jgi:hypothetical protein
VAKPPRCEMASELFPPAVPGLASGDREPVCHLSTMHLAGQELWATVCGRTLHEPECCSDGARACGRCGRPPCTRCDEIAGVPDGE